MQYIIVDYKLFNIVQQIARIYQSCLCALSVLIDSVIPQTVAHQAPPTMEFSRQEYWRELPFPSPGDFPNPGIKSGSPALQADSLLSEPPEKLTMHSVELVSF